MANLSLPTWIRSMERDPVRTLRSWCWWRPMTTMRRSTPWRSSSSSAWVAEMTSPESGPPRVLGSSCHCKSLTGFELPVYWHKQLPWDKLYSCGVTLHFTWWDIGKIWHVRLECRRKKCFCQGIWKVAKRRVASWWTSAFAHVLWKANIESGRYWEIQGVETATLFSKICKTY